jgi:hypothetical protein
MESVRNFAIVMNGEYKKEGIDYLLNNAGGVSHRAKPNKGWK